MERLESSASRLEVMVTAKRNLMKLGGYCVFLSFERWMPQALPLIQWSPQLERVIPT